jgi:hypothetical protein
LKSSDSKLVRAWKDAHLHSGLPSPVLQPQQCWQLSQLVKGPNGLPYHDVLNHVIPGVVGHWKEFCTWLMYRLVHMKSKAPFPLLPNPGLVLRYKALALDYVELSSEGKAAIVILCGESAKTGPLPFKLPKKKGWNSLTWLGHPPE